MFLDNKEHIFILFIIFYLDHKRIYILMLSYFLVNKIFFIFFHIKWDPRLIDYKIAKKYFPKKFRKINIILYHTQFIQFNLLFI